MSHLYLDDFPIYKSSNDITIGIKMCFFPFIITMMSPMPSLDGEIPSGWTNWPPWPWNTGTQGGSLTMPAVASSPQPVRSAREPKSCGVQGDFTLKTWPPWDLTMKNRGFNTNFLGDVSLRDGDLPMRNVEASNMWIEAAKTRIRSCTLWSNTVRWKITRCLSGRGSR